MTPAKLTVLMPAYNAERYIALAIESVLTQTFTEFQVLIVDDGSTDGTSAVIRSFNDRRITLIGQENQGVAKALNTGLQAARADLIVRFDADDICYPERLDIQYRFMIDHPEYVLAGSMVDYTDMEGRYVFTHRPVALTDETIRQLPYSICPFIHSSVIYRKMPVLSLGGYNIHAHGFEDHLLWHSLVKAGKLCNLAQVLMMVRFNPGSVTMDETCRSGTFLSIKYAALQKGYIDEAEGDQLMGIIRREDSGKAKESAYHVLLAKKYLWNNSQPLKARAHARQVVEGRYYTRKGYYLLLLSYLPGNLLVRLYRMFNASRI